jgi:hypothetical protein
MFALARTLRSLIRRRQAVAGEDLGDRLYAQASEAFEAGRHADAESLASQARTLRPGSWQLAMLHGLALLELGRWKESSDATDRALELGADHPYRVMAEMGRALALARSDIAAGVSAPQLELGPAPPSFSVIVCSISPDKFARVSKNYRRLLSGVAHEIIGIHDARSLCEGYNRGVSQSRGDILVFSHDDIEIVSPDFAARLVHTLAMSDLVGIAGTTKLSAGKWSNSAWPHTHGQFCHRNSDGSLKHTLHGLGFDSVGGIQAMDGLLFAGWRKTFEDVDFDAETFDGWHFYDLDFTFRAWLRGLRLRISYELLVVHDSEGSYDSNWNRYAQRFLKKHEGRFTPLPPPGDARYPTTRLRSAQEWLLVSHHLLSRREREAASGRAAPGQRRDP